MSSDGVRTLGAMNQPTRIDLLELDIDLRLTDLLDRTYGKLSAGQKTRVSLAKALLNEPELCRNLGVQSAPTLGFDPLEYIKSQLITVATSVGGQALGMSYPLGLTEEEAKAKGLVAKVPHFNSVLRALDKGPSLVAV